METAFRTPWVEIFLREEADDEVRYHAAQGYLAPRPPEQLALLMHLTSDADESVAAAAESTLTRIPRSRIEGLLARADAPSDIRAFFEARGILPAAMPDADSETPLVDQSGDPEPILPDDDPALEAASDTRVEDANAEDARAEERKAGALQAISQLGLPQRLALAMKGSRAERAILIRDPNKLISLAVLSSPKLTEVEVESFARMTSVSEEVPRTIAGARSWVKNYSICSALVKNSKTPLAISMNLLSRLNDKDLRSVSVDRNVPEVLRATARRKVASEKRN